MSGGDLGSLTILSLVLIYSPKNIQFNCALESAGVVNNLCFVSLSEQTLPPALQVQGDAGRGLHAESGSGRDALLLQGPPQCVCARGV